ncbi:cysteine peptidase family C39 domain-containing protein [Massilibacteroides vaginae]|uniref:cysteine peptidase family C39 domain-containing protein n=1 Tax=Massilibacteroides vaginae TaxID=1673718 RepID=UPI000A1CD068|nr:cysteine peptidase family C39 domain-containing protein [Massilibacteroides vaginae]
MKSFNFIRKTFVFRDIPSSGVMCLLSIIKYHKGYKDPAYLLSASKTTNGITLLSDLAKAAETIGLSTKTGSSTIDNLKKFPNPVILHVRNDWGEYDFVVCYGFNRNFFLVGVPSWGLMEFREDEMDVLWESRLILYIEPTNLFKRKFLF